MASIYRHSNSRTARLRIGARVWKTALAVTVAIALSRLLKIDHPVFAGVAAIICMQPTIAGSVNRGIERMQATIIGAAFSILALIALEVFPPLQVIRPAIIGTTVLLVMAVTIYIGWLDSLVLAAATVVVIMILPPDENIYRYSLSRTVVTLIGIVVATVVNAVFITPRHSKPFWQSIIKLTEATDKAYRQAVEAFCSRNDEMVRQAMALLDESEDLLKSAKTAKEWMEEEAELRQTIRQSNGSESKSLCRTVELLISIRQSTATILHVTTEILTKEPKYAEHPARIYDILRELSQPGFALLDRIKARHEGSSPTEDAPEWSEELHIRFIRGIREGHAEVFPLVESAVVESEIHRVTEFLMEMNHTTAHLDNRPAY